MKRLIFYHANPLLKDSHGRGLVHMSAEFGFESILVYLHKELKLGFEDTEVNGRTPLHIAALESQTHAGMLLIAWTKDLDQIDLEGFTPIHLASLSQNYRLVRNLIIRGARADLEDSKGDTALDIAINRGSQDIAEILVRYMQKPPSCTQVLNPFKFRVGPVSDSYTRLVFYVLLFLFRAAIIITVIYPRLQMEFWVAEAGIYLITLGLFVVACSKDPGYTRNETNIDLGTLLDKYRSDFICMYCEYRKSKNTRHCHYCNKCVKVLYI